MLNSRLALFEALYSYLGYVPDKNYGTFRRKSGSSEKIFLDLSTSPASTDDEEVRFLLRSIERLKVAEILNCKITGIGIIQYHHLST